MSSKATKAVVARRIEEVVRILLDGAEPLWDICEYVREKEHEAGSAWELTEGSKPLSDSQIRRYAVKAENVIAESCRASRKKLFRRHLAQRRNLYAKAVSQGNVRAALACLQDEAALLNLYPPKRTQVTGRNGGPVILNITEELIGLPAPVDLSTIVEEVVTCVNRDQSGKPEDTPPSGATGVPQE